MIAFRVLIIDDDVDDRDFLQEALEQAGIEPVLALASAQQVFSYLQTVTDAGNLPELIITDLNMQGITGFELLSALKGMQRYQHIPVAVYSTSSQPLDRRRCLLSGAIDYITKPNSMAGFRNVSARVKECLEN